jgi:glycosidase
MIIQIGDQSIKYTLQAREPGSSARKGFDNSDIIYLITPDRFANGDSTNDNLPEMLEQADRKKRGGRHGGDIKGMLDHLDYIKDMGFTTIWSMPLLENNLATYTYHGYAISDFYKTDPRFGNNELFRTLSLQAKANGLKTIMDVVLNHCSSGHWWMKNKPFNDWINYSGKYTNTNHRREVNQDIHASQYDKEKMQAGWFVETMPDMNTRNTFMATYLIQNTIWWIEYAHLAGLRIDTYPYVDKTFSSTWSKAVLNEYPNLNMVGEEWSYNPLIVSYWQKGGKNKDGYISSLKSLFDFPVQGALINGLNEKEGFNEGMIKLYQTLASDFVYPDANNLVIFADNHDMSRYFTQIHENMDRWKQGMVILMTMRGIPQLYYGTEVLLTNPLSDDHGEIRADMPGGWLGDIKNVFTKSGLNDKEKEALDFTKQLCNLRISAPALQKGKLVHFAVEKGVYVYFRILNEEKYMIVINKNNKEVILDPVTYREVLNTTVSFVNVLGGKTERMDEAMKLKGDGYKVLKF